MSECNKNVPTWRVLVVFILFVVVYLYLYTNAFYGMKTSSVFRVSERDLKAVWKDRFESVSHFLKLMEQDDKRLRIELSSSGSKSSPCAPETDGKSQDGGSKIQFALIDKLRAEILNNSFIPILTLFTSWNDDSEKHLVHNLTLLNWISLKPLVIPVLFTNETSVAEQCQKAGFKVLPISVGAADGIPVLKYMYEDVMAKYNSTFYAYSNGDILYTETLINTLLQLKKSSVDLSKPVLMVGQRTNVENVTDIEGSTWDNISQVAAVRGKLFNIWAEDFFVTSPSFPWSNIAEVVIGRRAYDNYLVYFSRKANYSVIDATKTVLAVHQTTKAGNFEGHSHKNKHYNHKLLVKMYKSIKYYAGTTACIETYTDYHHSNVVVKNRTVHKSCSV